MKQRKSKPRHRISRVTTRQGDGGQSQLADGSKRPKRDALFAALGDDAYRIPVSSTKSMLMPSTPTK